MIEVIAAGVGALLSGVAGGIITSAQVVNGRVRENREVVIRLTSAVENIGKQLEALHNDIRADRQEMYGRLTGLEQRTARLEGRIDHAP